MLSKELNAFYVTCVVLLYLKCTVADFCGRDGRKSGFGEGYVEGDSNISCGRTGVLGKRLITEFPKCIFY